MRQTSIHHQLLANWKKRCLRRLYQWALEGQEPERQLFLAVSQASYIKYFQKPIF
ncbi:element excision factor XisH family protein [Microcoleus sp. S13_C5]|uniref:element excision factor XisH family protein n=1 Tax=Microcoleus sp. S13_C5 TaxID=3055411 RepID=UPI002FD737E8